MNSKQLFWCRVYLLEALLLIVGAYIKGFRIFKYALASDYTFAMILTVMAGVFVAHGIKECAKRTFNTADPLYFACFSGFAYVLGILFLITTMFLMLSGMITDPMELKALRPGQMTFLLPASTILALLCMAGWRTKGFSKVFRFRLPKLFSFSQPKEYWPRERKFMFE